MGPNKKCPEGTRELSSGRCRIRQARIPNEGPKIKCPESQGGALGADEAEPGEGFDSGGSLREVSEPGTPLRASEALDGVPPAKFKFFFRADSEIVHPPDQA